MKKIIGVVLSVALSNLALAEDIKISVKGMVCGFCAQGITKKFKALPDIESVEVSLEKKLVQLKTKGSATLSDKTITEILTEAGYNIEKIEHN